MAVAALGLEREEARRRLAEHGPNELARGGGGSAWSALPTVPALRAVFHVQALSALETAACVGLGLIPVSLIELAKLARATLAR